MSSGGSRTQTVETTESEPWRPAQPHLKNLMSEASRLYRSGVGNEYYPFSTVVPYSNQTQSAFDMIENRVRAGSPLMDRANHQVSSMLGGQFGASPVNQYLRGAAQGDYLHANPYMDRAYNRAADQVTNRINQTAGLKGRVGSGAHQMLLQRELGDLANTMYGQNYQNERSNQINAINSLQASWDTDLSRRMNAISAAQALSQLPYQEAQMLANVGAQREEMAQKQLADLIGRHDFTQKSPWDRLANYSAIVNGMGSLGGTSTSNSANYGPEQNGLLGALGTGISLLSMIGS